MSKIITSEVNERRHRVIIDRHELKRIVGEAVAKELGIRHAAARRGISHSRMRLKARPDTRSAQVASSMWSRT